MVSVPIIAFVGVVSGWFMGASAAAWGALSVPLLVSGVLSHWRLSPAPGQILITLTGVGSGHRRL